MNIYTEVDVIPRVNVRRVKTVQGVKIVITTEGVVVYVENKKQIKE